MTSICDLWMDLKDWWKRQTRTSKILCIGVAGFLILAGISELVKYLAYHSRKLTRIWDKLFTENLRFF